MSKSSKILKRAALAVVAVVAVVVLVGGGYFTFFVIGGPANLIGMLRYDTRREGDLRVGTRAPDVDLLALDGKTAAPLLAQQHGRPLVVVFGSFT